MTRHCMLGPFFSRQLWPMSGGGPVCAVVGHLSWLCLMHVYYTLTQEEFGCPALEPRALLGR